MLFIKTAADKREINKYKQGQFSYADFGNGIVELTMASGEVVRLCFDKNSVKAERSYKVKDRAEQVYLIAFVYFYGRKTDIKIERSVTDMLGETITVKKNPKKVACASRTTYDLLIAFGLGDCIDGAYYALLENEWAAVFDEKANERY